MKYILTLSVVFFLNNTVFSQQVDSLLGIYAAQYQQEKIHIHFDKSAYNKGETIWFKAYLMAGNELSAYSKNVYVDWYNSNGRLLKHTVSPVFESSAKGQFEIPVNYAGQGVYVKAYTQWMLNFDSTFLYSKEIVVNQPPVTGSVPMKYITSVQFFPEGGDLVNGLNSKVAFKATNQFGRPVRVSGAIKNSRNELIDSFATQHDGMGNFSIEPELKEIYTVYWTDEYGHQDIAGLPLIKNNGAVMQVQSLPGKTIIGIKRSETGPSNLKLLYLVAHMNQEIVYQSKFNLNISKTGVAEIPTEQLSTGVLQVTLFNADWQPVAERVVFVNNHHYLFDTKVNALVSGTGKRNKNVIEIEVPDSISSNLSVAVTDEGLYNDGSNNIVSQFLLCDDIKGQVYEPYYYFSGNTDSIRQHLDLVMMTHGWRKFKWDEIAQGKTPTINYPRDSNYMQIKGSLTGRAFSRSKDKEFITLILQGKDSSKQFLILPLESDGSFIKEGMVFFDTAKVFYKINKDKRQIEQNNINLQTNLLPSPYLPVVKGSVYPWLFIDTSETVRNRFFAEENKKLIIASDATMLKEVTVYTKAKNSTDALNAKYTSGVFGGETSYSFDISNDQTALSSLDLFRYLQSMVAGLSVNYSQSRDMAPAAGATTASPAAAAAGGMPEIVWRGESPVLYLNEIETDADVLMNTPMTEIAYVKVFRPPFFGGWQGGRSGAISVYTRKPGDKPNNSVDGMDSKFLTGYSAHREFYSPDYSTSTSDFLPDIRTTLYWNPFVLTDAKTHKVKLEFYNNDISRKLRIVVEGMNAAGKLTRVEKVIE